MCLLLCLLQPNQGPKLVPMYVLRKCAFHCRWTVALPCRGQTSQFTSLSCYLTHVYLMDSVFTYPFFFFFFPNILNSSPLETFIAFCGIAIQLFFFFSNIVEPETGCLWSRGVVHREKFRTSRSGDYVWLLPEVWVFANQFASWSCASILKELCKDNNPHLSGA